MLAGPSNSGSSGHPKIQTESKDDILFLKKELESAGQMALADMSDSKATIGSPMEAQVQECINQWIDAVFDLAGDNIQINGLDYQEAFEEKQEFEPFNELLRQQVQEHQDLVLKKTLKVTDLRKSVPGQLVDLQKEEAKQFMETMESIRFGPESGKQDASMVTQEMKAMLDQYDFKSLSKEYQTSLEILQETEKMVPEMMQKLERAATVLDTLNVPDYEESTATPRKENHGFMDLDEPKTPKKKDGVTPKTARNGLLSHLD